MTREEFATKFAQKGIMGMTRDGDLDDIIIGGGGGGQGPKGDKGDPGPVGPI